MTNSDRSTDFMELFPVWCFLEGLDSELCALFATDVYLLCGAGVPLRAILSFKWKRLVIFRPSYLTSEGSVERENTIQGSYVKTLPQRSRRDGTFQVTANPGIGEALADLYSIWFYGTEEG